MNIHIWQIVRPSLEGKFDPEDDPALWEVVINRILSDAALLCLSSTKRQRIQALVGRCSHWERPHQTRWTADGGFAYPDGYANQPEHDWSILLTWNVSESRWLVGAGKTMKVRRPLVFRISVPSRSKRHRQAAVHTVWRPGPPSKPSQPVVQLYGFRRLNNIWKCTASSREDPAWAELAAHREKSFSRRTALRHDQVWSHLRPK